MSLANTLSLQYLRNLHIFAVIIICLLGLALMPHSARAEELSQAQIDSVTNLLQSFNVDTETVGAVEAILDGSYGSSISQGEKGKSSQNKNQAAEKAKKLKDMPMAPKQGTTSKERATTTKGWEEKKGEFPGKAVGMPACVRLARTLLRGHRGEDVKQLQKFLKETGDFTGATTTTYFGPATEQAVKKWQMRMGIATSGNAATSGFGLVGPKTRGQIVSHCMRAGGAPGLTKPQPTSTPTTTPPVATTTSTTTPPQATTTVSYSPNLIAGAVALSDMMLATVVVAPFVLVTESLGEVLYQLGLY